MYKKNGYMLLTPLSKLRCFCTGSTIWLDSAPAPHLILLGEDAVLIHLSRSILQNQVDTTHCGSMNVVPACDPKTKHKLELKLIPLLNVGPICLFDSRCS